MLLRLALLAALIAPAAAAQTPDRTARTPGTTVSGIVHDSIDRGPLAGAIVQMIAADSTKRFSRTAISDPLGRYTFADVPVGHYTMGFFHPMLDSLGMGAPLREVYVDGPGSVRADLAIPSPSRLRAAICGPQSVRDSSALLVGVVRDARDHAPIGGATVIGEWLEYSFRPGGYDRRVPRLVATTGANGWFAMCSLPKAGTIALIASRGADSTGVIEVQIPAEGFARRELYVGSVQTIVTADTTRRPGPLATVRRVHVGDGRLTGTVVTAVGGQPLEGALVSITNGPETRANERGEWTLRQAPVGTRMLEVRAVGYYPDRRRVHVVEGAPPLRIALSTLKSVLDTVRISASRRLQTRERRGFEERQRTAHGRFLTAEDIARRQPVVVSDLFRMMPGMRVGMDSTGMERHLLVRSAFEWCKPEIYLDGINLMDGLTADDIDAWVRPAEVAGIEVYTETSAPAEFQRGMTGCGSVVIWTK